MPPVQPQNNTGGMLNLLI